MKRNPLPAAPRATLLVAVLLFCAGPAPAQAPRPHPRYLHQVAYDEQHNQVLMYGGFGGVLLNDLWAYSNAGWKRLSEGGPAPRIKAAFAYDANRKTAVLFGGSGSEDKLLNDTWEWSGKAWKEVSVKGPSARNHPMAAYDRKNKVVIMFGGVGLAGLLSDTWTFDGASWKSANIDGPKNCLPHGIFYNEANETVVLMTLSVIRDPGDEAHARNDLWEWTGSSWKQLSPAWSIVTSSNLQSLSSFGKDEIVLFDGDDGVNGRGKTCSFSGGLWTSSLQDGPAPRIGAGMVYDQAKKKSILFGGGNRTQVFNDLWEWDGKSWREVK